MPSKPPELNYDLLAGAPGPDAVKRKPKVPIVVDDRPPTRARRHQTRSVPLAGAGQVARVVVRDPEINA